MSLILKVFNYSNPVENYPDRQIQMLWVSLSFLKYASGWQSAGAILLINSNKTLNSAKIILLKMLYIHSRQLLYQECSCVPSEPDEQEITYGLGSGECTAFPLERELIEMH